jgi:hypothetical protein
VRAEVQPIHRAEAETMISSRSRAESMTNNTSMYMYMGTRTMNVILVFAQLGLRVQALREQAGFQAAIYVHNINFK